MFFRIVSFRRRRPSHRPSPCGLWGPLLLTLAVLALLSALLLQVMDTRLRPTIMAFAESWGRNVATEAMNDAVKTKIVQSIRYEDLMLIRTDTAGKVALVQPNTGEINRLASTTIEAVQDSLARLASHRFSIPFGQVLGSPVFASRGPRIRVSVIPIGSVTANVNDRFEQAGINQTRHRIYLSLKTSIRIVVPLAASTVEVTSRVPIAEVVIMGEVPQVYFGGGGKVPATSALRAE